MSEWVGIDVGRQNSHAFHVGSDEQGPYVFVRDPNAPRYEVSRQDGYVQVSALQHSAPVLADIAAYAYVTIHSDINETLRGPISLYRMEGETPVETVADQIDYTWRFSPLADPDYWPNNLWYGQNVGFGFKSGFGKLRRDSSYRMQIRWYSYSTGGVWSYNALQIVDFVTTDTTTLLLGPFEKKVVQTAPEW